MQLITPGIGLIFWTTLVFVIVFFVLAKFAWKPIMEALREREKNIEDALQAAENAKASLTNLKAESEKLLAEARKERDQMIKDAQAIAANMVSEAQAKANSEGAKILESAKAQIISEKNAAILELKSLVATTSIEIAEQIIKKELGNDQAHKDLIDSYIKTSKFN